VRPRPFRRRRDRGFSLLIVFMLMIVMVGTAATVILSTQQDLSIAGQDREALQAFYAAEYAVAAAKDTIASKQSDYWASATGWTPLLSSGIDQLCAPSASPTTTPGTAPTSNNTWQDFLGGTAWVNADSHSGATSGPRVQYRWCVHNDFEDVNYAVPVKTTPGDTNDDTSNLIVIEGYGRVTNDALADTASAGLAMAHVWVTIGKPSGTPSVFDNCYSQEGGCGSHGGSNGTSESNIGVVAPSGSPTTVRGL
jgi:Tfp pilus assembly protein PilX